MHRREGGCPSLQVIALKSRSRISRVHNRLKRRAAPGFNSVLKRALGTSSVSRALGDAAIPMAIIAVPSARISRPIFYGGRMDSTARVHVFKFGRCTSARGRPAPSGPGQRTRAAAGGRFPAAVRLTTSPAVEV